jgi:hypothetical protein
MRNTIETFTQTNFTGRRLSFLKIYTLCCLVMIPAIIYVSTKCIAIDEAGIAITIWIYIREVLSSNLRRNTGYSELQ